MSQDIKLNLQEAVKDAMRAKDQQRLGTLRLVMAAIKQKEIDSRVELGDQPLNEQQILAVLDKMVKQRRESIEQYKAANRDDLADKESSEIQVIEEFLPAQLSETEIDQLITKAMSETGASSAKDMGKVMAILKPELQGRADIKVVSEKIKAKLQ